MKKTQLAKRCNIEEDTTSLSWFLKKTKRRGHNTRVWDVTIAQNQRQVWVIVGFALPATSTKAKGIQAGTVLQTDPNHCSSNHQSREDHRRYQRVGRCLLFGPYRGFARAYCIRYLIVNGQAHRSLGFGQLHSKFGGMTEKKGLMGDENRRGRRLSDSCAEMFRVGLSGPALAAIVYQCLGWGLTTIITIITTITASRKSIPVFFRSFSETLLLKENCA